MTDSNDEARQIAYFALGRLIAGEWPAGFATAALTMEIDEESGTRLWTAPVQPDATRVQLQPEGGAAQDLLESLRGIRNAMAEEDSRLWRRCVVTLKAGGHFAMDVEY